METTLDQLKHALQKVPNERTVRDRDIIYAYLHGLEEFKGARVHTLQQISCQARYEFHEANDILYCRGELATCWYVLLSGSVFIDGCMFLARSSFGKKTPGCSRRPNECLILEPSEMIAVDYNDFSYLRPSAELSGLDYTSYNMGLATDDAKLLMSRYQPDVLTHGVQRPDTLNMEGLTVTIHDGLGKRSSRASDTSSAYSGSDMMQSSSVGDDQDNLYDSDDEDADETTSLIVRDTVRECLEKDPSERTEDDLEILLEFMQHLPAFANMTLATRRKLCGVMVYAVVDKAGTVVMKDGEELDSWSVILNGHVEIQRPDGSIEHLHMGDSFGVTPTKEKLYHKGVMRTKVDDCQFVCIAQDSYYAILHEGQENIERTYDENNEVILIRERRSYEDKTKGGHIVLRGTPNKLMAHLMEEQSSADPTYVEDFLLTFRTFIKSPLTVAQQLKQWFNNTALRDKVTRVVLLWVNNHYNDFETDPAMSEFLEQFENLLEENRMGGQLRLLNIACAAKAQPRQVVLSRRSREEVLPFQILGGIERSAGVFISSVTRPSKAAEAGLKRGDQIIEVNNQNFQHIAHKRALEILRGSTHLAITVKSNLLDFKEMLSTTDNSPKLTRHPFTHFHNSLPLTGENNPHKVNHQQPIIAQLPRDKGGGAEKESKKGAFSIGKQKKLKKALFSKVGLAPAKGFSSDNSSVDGGPRSLQGSLGGSEASSPRHRPLGLAHSLSNPDLHHWDPDGPDHVLKVFRSDQTFKFLLVHRETTSHEVVMLSLKEFSMSEPSSEFCLCEVSVEGEGFLKTRRLPDQLTGLPDRLPLHARYYIKSNSTTEPLVSDEMIPELQREFSISLLQLAPSEVAAQLMLRDFLLFRSIDSSEYIDDLFELDSKYGTPHLSEFSRLVNTEMFWVINEVCSESNLVKRVKLLKHFIKIARHCKDCKNYNSMFALVSGLGHGAVSRLRLSWERLPTKYTKMYEDLQDLMDPSRNMSKYRNLINSERIQPPLIPFFPVIKKDLTFIHLGNDSKVDGLVNFEKLRMIAKEIRHAAHMASSQYDMSQMYLRDSQTVFSVFNVPGSSAVATMRRKRRSSMVVQPKKMFEEAQMVRRVRAYLKSLKVEEDESRLTELSHQCEPSANNQSKRRDASPTEPPFVETNLGPKFGAESPQAVRKLMGLAEKARPYNPKGNPLPPQHLLQQPKSPMTHPRGLQSLSSGGPASPRAGGGQKAPLPSAVTLSAESSSVVSLNKVAKSAGLRGKSRTDTADSGVAPGNLAPKAYSESSSTSPTNSVGSYTQAGDTDSGHNSITSSTLDGLSNASNSPQALHKANAGWPQGLALPPSAMYPPQRQPQMPPLNCAASRIPNGSTRPPPYHMAVRHHPGHQRLQTPHVVASSGQHTYHLPPQQHPPSRRPALPDYHTAAAHRRHQPLHSYPHQQQQQHLGVSQQRGYPAVHPNHHARSRSYDLTPPPFYSTSDDNEELVDDPATLMKTEEEQVSAV